MALHRHGADYGNAFIFSFRGIASTMKKHLRNQVSHLRYLVLVLCIVSGCSPYMEATRPTPVDLSTFTPGESRESIIEQTGAPVTTTKDAAGETCDLHLLYTTGYGTAVKVPLAVLEGAADFFSAGLAEIILSPTESITRNEKKRVWFCFKNDSLTTVTVESSKTETADASSSTGATPSDSPMTPTSAPTQAPSTATPIASPSPAP